MENALTVILQQGPLGAITVLFIYMYLSERSKNSDLQVKISEIHKHNYETLDKVRESQIRREQEVASTLEEYGKGVIQAVHHSTVVSEELRRLHNGNK